MMSPLLKNIFKKSLAFPQKMCYNIRAVSFRWCGSVVEQLIRNQQVEGSIPSTSSKKRVCKSPLFSVNRKSC